MGQMKQFGMKLANMVYADRMTDEAIIKSYLQSMPVTSVEWLKEQIKSVRDNPKMWKPVCRRDV